jgi:hypothetical protein
VIIQAIRAFALRRPGARRSLPRQAIDLDLRRVGNGPKEGLRRCPVSEAAVKSGVGLLLQAAALVGRLPVIRGGFALELPPDLLAGRDRIDPDFGGRAEQEDMPAPQF